MWLASKLLFLVWMTAFAQFAFATNKVGNGGNSVICRDVSARLLDFYEADLTREFDKSLDEYGIAKQVFERLKIAAPDLGLQYLNRLSTIREQIEFKDGVILTDTQDSNHLFKPAAAGCEVVQTAIRRTKPVASEKAFLFRKDVWEKLPALDRAGLLAHEILYEHFSKLGESTSVKARKVNALLFANEKYTTTELWKLFRDLEIPVYP